MKSAYNGRISIDGEITDYIRFGNGKRTAIMIPGVGDGFKTVKGMALPFAFLYRALKKEFTVYSFSRPVNLKEGATTRDMSESLAKAIRSLGLPPAFLIGVSQGGMIAQWLAIDHPELVEKLVLVVTMGRPNDTVNTVIGRWVRMAESGDYRGIMMDTAAISYTPQKAKRSKVLYSLLSGIVRPKSLKRFLIQANACLTHNAYEQLREIKCPTLIIGGTEDQIVSGEASRELAEQIPGSELQMYEGMGHGLYEEAKDFVPAVAKFCLR